MILSAKHGEEVDHINGDGLDNRRANLRVCTHSENAKNKRKQRNNISGFKGVSFNKKMNRWKGQLEINGKSIYLGFYTDPIDAAKAYDEAARKYYGNFANVNF
jgi:hypothetical protein